MENAQALAPSELEAINEMVQFVRGLSNRSRMLFEVRVFDINGDFAGRIDQHSSSFEYPNTDL